MKLARQESDHLPDLLSSSRKHILEILLKVQERDAGGIFLSDLQFTQINNDLGVEKMNQLIFAGN